MKRTLLLAALASAAAFGQALAVETQVAPPSADLEDLARVFATTARTAEAQTAVGDPAKVQQVVASSVEEVIVTAAKPPTNVRVALQRAVYVCMRPAEVKRYGFNCPGTEAGVQGLRDVLATVTALIEGSETAAIDGLGGTALGALPALEGGGGADYQQLRQ